MWKEEMSTATLIIGCIFMIPVILLSLFADFWKETLFPFFNGPVWAVIVVVIAISISHQLYLKAQRTDNNDSDTNEIN